MRKRFCFLQQGDAQFFAGSHILLIPQRGLHLTDVGLTQQQLAERCGIRQSNISRIENGTCSPTVATLQKIAAGMGKKLRIEFI